MNKNLLSSALSLLGLFASIISIAQDNIVENQNPNFEISRSKYMAVSDSVNQWHGTTVQQTYKAYDWYEQKQERKRERLEFRREMRRPRNYYQQDSYYYRPYHNNRYYNNRYYNRPNHWLFWCF